MFALLNHFTMVLETVVMSEFLLVAIDGTWSSREGYSGVYNDELRFMCVQNSSYTRQFYRDVAIPAEDKYFHHGPESGITGLDATEIATNACRWLRTKIRQSPDAKIILVGHSRGGHIVTQIAILLGRLNRDHFRGFCPANPPARSAAIGDRGVPVHFLGLYDAVDMTVALGNTQVVPRNVIWLYHAQRSARVGSRASWGNAATHSARRDPVHYHAQQFDATHGAVGGAIPEACDEGIFSGCNYDLGLEQNRAAGEAANQWVRGGAQRAGVPFRS